MVGLELIEGQDSGPQVLADTAYSTGDARAALTEGAHAGHQPGPLTLPVVGGFTTDDFAVDEDAGTMT